MEKRKYINLTIIAWLGTFIIASLFYWIKGIALLRTIKIVGIILSIIGIGVILVSFIQGNNWGKSYLVQRQFQSYGKIYKDRLSKEVLIGIGCLSFNGLLMIILNLIIW